jgi:hypothetical protein
VDCVAHQRNSIAFAENCEKLTTHVTAPPKYTQQESFDRREAVSMHHEFREWKNICLQEDEHADQTS